MLRIYSEAWTGGFQPPNLSDEEIHHLVRVRRVRVGESIQLLNGRGNVGRARVVDVDPDNFTIDLDAVNVVDAPNPRISLHVGLPKGKVFPSILHRAVELGVSEVVPVLTDHSEVSAERGQSKQDRWRSVLIEALKQSGNPYLPELASPMTFEQALDYSAESSRLVLGLVPDAVPIKSLVPSVRQGASTVSLFVGPEGDFSEKEYALLRECGSQMASLGPLVLKVETAAVVALGILQLYPGLS